MAIQETTFGPKTYLALKKTISTDQVMDKDMYEQAGRKLGAYLEANDIVPTGPWTVMYFTWDMENKTTDLAIAVPVNELEKVNDAELSIVHLPESKAAMDTMIGSYDKLGEAHQAMITYTEEHGYERGVYPVMALEEYTVGAMQDPVTENWKTDIYYFHN